MHLTSSVNTHVSVVTCVRDFVEKQQSSAFAAVCLWVWAVCVFVHQKTKQLVLHILFKTGLMYGSDPALVKEFSTPVHVYLYAFVIVVVENVLAGRSSYHNSDHWLQRGDCQLQEYQVRTRMHGGITGISFLALASSFDFRTPLSVPMTLTTQISSVGPWRTVKYSTVLALLLPKYKRHYIRG